MKTKLRKSIAALCWGLTFAAALALAPRPALAGITWTSVNSLVGPPSAYVAHNATWLTILADGFTSTAWPGATGSRHAWVGATFSVTAHNEANYANPIPCSIGFFVDDALKGILFSASIPANIPLQYVSISGQYADPIGGSLAAGSHTVALKLYSPGAVGCTIEANQAWMRVDAGPTWTQ
jgi:hypothetical protein